ncbi:MAG: hypothetical protein L0Z73_08005 [Gammaproteobacteria bacterium]|nr:hypothetical protein [Gammaproteobacteria bacterium]
MDELMKELIDVADRTKNNARQNHYAAFLVAILTALSSVIATILAAVGGKNEWAAIFAAVPVTMIAINSTFRFEKKSAWHWRKNKKIEALIRSLKYEDAKPDAVSKQFSQIEVEMDEEWVQFGSPGKTEE